MKYNQFIAACSIFLKRAILTQKTMHDYFWHGGLRATMDKREKEK